MQVKTKTLEQKREREKSLRWKIDDFIRQKERQESVILGLLDEMADIAADFFFDEHAFISAELKKDLFNPYEFKMLKAETDRYRGKISNACKALEEQCRKEQSYDAELMELEHAGKDREDARREREKAENFLMQIKEEFIEKVYTWEKSNAYLKIPQEQMPHIVRAVHSYGTGTTYDDIKAEARKHYITSESAMHKKLLGHEAIKKSLEDIQQNKQRELEVWKSKNDPEPERAAKTETYKRILDEAGIPHIPLYQAVDFRPEVDMAVRGRIEEALTDMGLLDALVIPFKYLSQLPAFSEGAGDKYIVQNPQFCGRELSMLLQPISPTDGTITYKDIDNVLKSIMIDDKNNGTSVEENGQYCIGLLKGKAIQESTPRFLGIEARKIYRQKIMDTLVLEITQIRQSAGEQDFIILEWKQKTEALEKEMESFPLRADMETAFNTLDLAVKNLKARDNEVVRRQEASDKLYTELKIARDRVRELARGLQIPLILEEFETAEKSAGIYRDRLSGLEIQHSALLAAVQNIIVHEEQTDEVLADVDTVWGDIRDIKWDIEEDSSKRGNLEHVLLQTDYETIKSEVENCIRELNEIPHKLEFAIRASQDNMRLYKTALESLEKIRRLAEDNVCLANAAMEGFKLEYDLGYVVKYEEERTPQAVAKKILTEYKPEDKAVRLRDEYTNSFHNRYRENMQYLVQYNLRIDTVFDEGEKNGDDAVSRILAQRKRMDLVAKVQGRDVNFYTMAAFIGQSIEENENLLKESDRQLFEDILANTVGKKIRVKIYHSE